MAERRKGGDRRRKARQSEPETVAEPMVEETNAEPTLALKSPSRLKRVNASASSTSAHL